MSTPASAVQLMISISSRLEPQLGTQIHEAKGIKQRERIKVVMLND
jgi:hypothetical protein